MFGVDTISLFPLQSIYNDCCSSRKWKRVMNDAKHLFSAIEKKRRDMYKTFTIPGNISAAMLIQMMNANEGSGILCETEADTITNALNQDWGDFSDILRKGFHYEEVSYARKGEEEKIKAR